MFDTQEETPSVSIDTTFTKDGLIGTLLMRVLSVSVPIQTSDLRITTSWIATNSTTGDIIRGGAVVDGAKSDATPNAVYNGTQYSYSTPIAIGPGVSGTTINSGNFGQNQWFGNYTLVSGTVMSVNSARDNTAGYRTLFVGEPMSVILGEGWEELKLGDIVELNIIYTPTGGLLYTKQVGIM